MRENFSLSCRKKKTQEKNDSAVEGKDCRFWVKKILKCLQAKHFCGFPFVRFVILQLLSL